MINPLYLDFTFSLEDEITKWKHAIIDFDFTNNNREETANDKAEFEPSEFVCRKNAHWAENPRAGRLYIGSII